jgi:ribonuclease J
MNELENFSFCPKPDSLYVLLLGGVGEIGKNMMALLYGSEMVAIDAGVMFPKEELGIDYIIPDIQFLLRHKEKLKGIFLTHGHEDHIGALPYILPKLNVPIFGTKLTLGFARAKLREFGLDNAISFHEIKPGKPVAFEKFTLDFFPNVHSINDGVGIVLKTPVGTLVHSGDFKFDQTPVNGMATDFKTLTTLGESGITLLFSDSTYAERPGYSLSEKVVGCTLNQLFSKAKGRIILATFASSIPRIQQVVEAAFNHQRKICFLGKSMVENVETAYDLGFLHIPDGMIVSESELNSIPDTRLAILTTGSQGEPFSALWMMANKMHRTIEIKPHDTVILSASPIPGNEAMVYRTINQLFKQGAEVIWGTHDSEWKVHVQGHAAQEELKLFLNLLKPKFFVPIHGEYRQLIHHARLARDVGIPPENILLAVDGDVLEITKESARVATHLPVEEVFVDGKSVSGVAKSILKERRALAEEGIFAVSIILSKETGALLAPPQMLSRGFVFENGQTEILKEAAEVVVKFFEDFQGKNQEDEEILKGSLKGALNRFFGEKVGRKPIILPLISRL